MAEQKKFLDQEGVKHLWSKISMEDYPNNETLIAVLNAIDQTKADKDYVQSVVSQKTTDFSEVTNVPDWISTSKPVYTADDVGADPSGSANNAITESKNYTDEKIASLINGAPTTLDTLAEIAEAMAENEDVVSALDAAIGTKAPLSDLTSHTSNKSNPHEVTKEQLGLKTESWTFTMIDGSTVVKDVVVV